MNSNEASQTRRLESVSFVGETARTSPVEKDWTQTSEREGEKSKRRTPEKVSWQKMGAGGVGSSNESGEVERGGPSSRLYSDVRIVPLKDLTQTSSGFKSLFIRAMSVWECLWWSLVGWKKKWRLWKQHAEFKFKLANPQTCWQQECHCMDFNWNKMLKFPVVPWGIEI